MLFFKELYPVPVFWAPVVILDNTSIPIAVLDILYSLPLPIVNPLIVASPVTPNVPPIVASFVTDKPGPSLLSVNVPVIWAVPSTSNFVVGIVVPIPTLPWTIKLFLDLVV